MTQHYLYAMQPFVLGMLLFAAGTVFAIGCVAAVRRWSWTLARRRSSELVVVVLTTVALLYSVLLAFLAVAVWEDFGDATQNTRREASLVHSLHHDAATLSPPIAADMRRQMIAYLDRVITVEWPMQARGNTSVAGAPALARAHRLVATLVPRDASDVVVMGDMLRLLNDLDAARDARLNARAGQIPPLIWTLIVLAGLLTIALGALLPGDEPVFHVALLAAMVLAIVFVMLMIVEMDHPFRGAISVSPTPFILVRDQLAASQHSKALAVVLQSTSCCILCSGC